MTDLVPHRWPFLFIGKVLVEDPDNFQVSADFSPDNPYIGTGVVPRTLLIEAMAQAVAAQSKVERASNGVPAVKRGFLALVKNVEFFGDCAAGEPVVLQVRHTRTFGRLFWYQSEARTEHGVICRGDIVAAEMERQTS